jgi:RNA polymerase sigma-70 factor (ECF subfamily)
MPPPARNRAAQRRPIRQTDGVYIGEQAERALRKEEKRGCMPMEMDTTDLIARARAGDHNAFRDLVQGHSHELQVHCYRILGSLQDAEDALQETLVSAWRNLGEFGQRSSLRTWLYKIATNRCLSMLRADSRRPRIAPPLPEATLPEPTGAGDAPPWLEPYPDVLLDHLVDQRPGPEARYETTEAISLAFITALQLLPPRQRAALVLRDVLGYHAAEVAQMLGTTQEAVNSALKRARATVDNHLADSSSTGSTGSGSSGTGSRRPARQPDTAAEHRLVARLTDALERSDLDALIELLVTDVRLSMPPAMLEYRGIESAQRILAAVSFRPGRTYRVVPTRANGQPAFGLYLADPHASVYRAYCLLVITTAGDHITAITSFSTNVMTRFGLPRTLPETD